MYLPTFKTVYLHYKFCTSDSKVIENFKSDPTNFVQTLLQIDTINRKKLDKLPEKVGHINARFCCPAEHSKLFCVGFIVGGGREGGEKGERVLTPSYIFKNSEKIATNDVKDVVTEIIPSDTSVSFMCLD